MSDNHSIDVRPFYFSQMVVSPENDEKVYFLSFSLMESDDGGKTVHDADKGVHPDHHALWIDPESPQRMIQGNDGAVYLSSDGAGTWRFLRNLPIEQFYTVSTDTSTPYNLCGGLQDNDAWCGPSNSLTRGGISGTDWFIVAGGDGQYAVPAPSDPSVIYADSQEGFIVRMDKRTHVERFVRPYLAGAQDMPRSELKYRFNWTTPIAERGQERDSCQLFSSGMIIYKEKGGI